MKRIYIIVILLALNFSVLIDKSYPAEWASGLVSYYGWWKPPYSTTNDNFKIDPMVLVGPVVSASINRRLSFSLMAISTFTTWFVYVPYASYDDQFTGSAGDGTARFNSDISRTEIDLTASCRLNDLFTIFGGCKIYACGMGYPGVEIIKGPYTFENGTKSKGDSSGQIYGGYSGGLGINIRIPIAEQINLIIGESLIYSIADLSVTEIYEKSSGIVDEVQNTYNHSYRGIGSNSTITFSYYFSTIDTALSLGGRFQYIKYYNKSDGPDLGADIFGGIMLSAIYYF